MTATPSQEWTQEDERVVQQNARASDLGYGDEFVYRLSRAFLRQRDEVARLRAENERLAAANESQGRTVAFTSALNRALRSHEHADEMDAIAKDLDMLAAGVGEIDAETMTAHAEDLRRFAEVTRVAAPADQYLPNVVKWEVWRDKAEALRCSEHWEESEARAEIASLRARHADNPHVRLALVRSTTSRSRVSDNGK